MSQEITLSPDESQVIANVSRSFARQMHWNHRWEPQDIYQELCLFWLKRRRSGWKKPPNNWKGAMGRCLGYYLKDIQRKERLGFTRTNGLLSSLDLLMEEGFDCPTPNKKPFLFDFQQSLGSPERQILNLLAKGSSKKSIAQKLGKSRVFVHQKLRSVKRLVEQFL